MTAVAAADLALKEAQAANDATDQAAREAAANAAVAAADEAVDVEPAVKPKPRRRRASSRGFGYPGTDGAIPSFSDGDGVVVDAVVESADVPVDAAV